jgi:general secretion pathway protein G
MAQGFTLVELLIVITVLGVLAAIVVFALGGITGKSAVAACNADATTVDTAVQTYKAETGGTLPVTPQLLMSTTNPYLQSFPTSPYFAISIDSGNVMIAAPIGATPVQYGTPDACAGASATPSSTTTSPPTSTTNSTTTTTSTSTTTTTTTTTIPQSNGVSATGAFTRSGKRGTEVLTVSNRNALAALTITIVVNPSAGETITYNSEKFSFTKKDFSDSESTSGGDVSYTYTLDAGDTIAANSRGTATAVFTSNLTTHASSGDSWSVSSVSNGVSAAISGTF